MIWHNRGFLPLNDPIEFLSVKNENYQQFLSAAETLAANMPEMINSRCVRQEIVCQLREVSLLFDHELFNNLEAMDERAFLVYGFLAAAYVNTAYENPMNRLAKEITVPLVRLAERVQRQAVLDYHSYILYNWRRKDKNKSIAADNLEPLLTFSGSKEEADFIVSHLLLEMHCDLLSKISLDDVLDSMLKIARNIPDISEIKSHFKPFVNINFEGWGWQEPQSFGCYLLDQSPILAAIAKSLGLKPNVCHRPSEHRQLIDSIKPKIGDLHKFTELVTCMTRSNYESSAFSV